MKISWFLPLLCFALFACNLFSPPGSQEAAPSLPVELLSADKPSELFKLERTAVPTGEEIKFESAEDGIAVAAPVARPDFPPPSIEPVIPIPPLADPLPLPAGTVNVLLLGSDAREPFSGVRTDTLLLVSFHPKEDSVKVVSFPRDLFVYIPGWTMRRINEAYQHGGFDLLVDTFDYNFGIRPSFFVLVNFSAFEKAVDSMEGLDVHVARSLQEGDYSVEPGLVHMDGKMALWYVRSRYTTSDFERMQRQQEVLLAIFQRMISLDVLKKIPQMYAVYEDSVETNIDLQDVLVWANVARRMVDKQETLHMSAIDREYVTPFRTPAGAQVLLPDRESIRSLFEEIFQVR